MAQEALLPPVAPPSGPNLHAVGEQTGRCWRFAVEGVPVPQGSMKATLNRNTGRVVMFASNAKKLKPWREQITLTARALRPSWLRKPIDGPVGVGLVFVRARPKSHFRTDGVSLGAGATRFPDTKPDVDKLERAILDGLTEVAFVDDARVVSLVSVKRWAEPGEGEKVEVEITAL